MDWTLLRDLPEPDRRRITQAAVRRRYAKGDIVFHEGDAGDALHFISRGRAAVRGSTPMGEIATFAILGAGEFFGEQALVSNRAVRTASIVALEPLETLAITAATFEQLRQAHPSVERFLVGVLAGQVRRLSAHLMEALFLPAEKRVARRLVVLAHKYTADAAADAPVTVEHPAVVPLTQEHLATLAGTTRPTVNRVLREMEDEGAVRLRRGRVEIIDVRALRRRA